MDHILYRYMSPISANSSSCMVYLGTSSIRTLSYLNHIDESLAKMDLLRYPTAYLFLILEKRLRVANTCKTMYRSVEI